MQLVRVFAAEDGSDGGFHGPSIDEFFPEAILFAGTPFELNRVMLVRLIAFVVLLLILWLGTRNMKVVPDAGPGGPRVVLGFVRNSVVIETLGEKDGKRFMPVLMTIFFVTLALNLTGIIPPFLIASTAVIGMPLIMALVAYAAVHLRGHPAPRIPVLQERARSCRVCRSPSCR